MKRYFIKWFSFLFPRGKKISKVKDPMSISLKAFETVLNFLNNIPNINYGGCGISTLVLFDHAKAAGLKAKIIFGYSPYGGGFIENQDYKKGIRPHAESASHIFINIEGKDIDSGGEYKRNNLWEFDSQITREHLVNSIKYGSWNDCFERKEWLPKIEKFIGYKLI